MTVEAYYDGDAVRPVSPLVLEKNQRVFITVPEKESEADRQKRITEQFNALKALSTLLDKDEIKMFEQAMRPEALV